MNFDTLDKMVELQKLRALGVSEEHIKGLDVIVLPENMNAQNEDLHDAQHAITLSKQLKASGVKCANSYDLGLDLPTTERRSNDIWLGHLYIFNDLILPTIVGVVSSVLATSISERLKRKDLREPASSVHIDITIIRPEGKNNIRYSGDPETFIKIIKTLQKD